MAAPPESTKNSLPYRLNAHARAHWPQVTALDVRYRGQFAYVEAELVDGTTQPLIRLRYGGSAQHWGFGLYLASSDKYQNQILPSGFPTGSPEEPSTAPAASTSAISPETPGRRPRRTSDSDH